MGAGEEYGWQNETKKWERHLRPKIFHLFSFHGKDAFPFFLPIFSHMNIWHMYTLSLWPFLFSLFQKVENGKEWKEENTKESEKEDFSKKSLKWIQKHNIHTDRGRELFSISFSRVSVSKSGFKRYKKPSCLFRTSTVRKYYMYVF